MSKTDLIDDGGDVKEDYTVAFNAQQFVQTLLQSLHTVDQVQDAVLSLVEQVRPALKAIVDHEMADIVQSRRNAAQSARTKSTCCYSIASLIHAYRDTSI